MKRKRFIFLCLMLMLTASGVLSALTKGGTEIVNTAVITYEDPQGNHYTQSASVSVIVETVCQILILPDGTTEQPGRVFDYDNGAEVHIPYFLQNPGNVEDSYSLTVSNIGGDDYDLSELGLYIDTNGNGVLDPGEPPYDNDNPQILQPGEGLDLVLFGITPATQNFGVIWVNVSGESACSPIKQDLENVVEIRINVPGTVTLVKSADQTEILPGDEISYTISFMNNGGKPVSGISAFIDGTEKKGVIVYDVIPEQTTYVSGSLSHSSDPAFVPIYAGDDGVWKTSESQVNGKIVQVGLFMEENPESGIVLSPNQGGSFSLRVVTSPGTPPQEIENVAYSQFNNQNGDQIRISSTVSVTIPQHIDIVVDDTDENNHSGEGIHNDPDDLMEIYTTAVGSWISFNNEVCNFGNVTDIINFFLDAESSIHLPENAQVKFYEEIDGELYELTDTNGDGIIDSGPLSPMTCRHFVTRVFIPEDAVGQWFIAIYGQSTVDPSIRDYTFESVTIGELVLIRVLVTTENCTESSDWKTETPWRESEVVVYTYDQNGNFIEQKRYYTDDEGYVIYNETHEYDPLYYRMEGGYSYRVTLADSYQNYTYDLSPDFFLSDFSLVQNPGDYYERDDIYVQMMGNNAKVLTAVVDPFGYVYDGITGQKIDGACVTLYRCDTSDCGSYHPVDADLLDLYPNGQRPQQNGQTTGKLDNDGYYVNKGTGDFSYEYKEFSSLDEGWYFVETNFSCNALTADPDLIHSYEPIALDNTTIWAPGNCQPYQGGKFFLTEDFNGAMFFRIPLMPANFQSLEVTKKVTPNTGSIGDILKFTVTVTNNNTDYMIYDVDVFDTLPRELRYLEDSTIINSVKAKNPAIETDGVGLTWEIGNLSPGQSVEIVFYTRIISGYREGWKVNTVYAAGWSSADHLAAVVSNTAFARFRLEPDVFDENGFIIGKVFIDTNDNRIQDENEQGVKDVKIYTEDGRYVVTDNDGKYHFDNIRPGTHVLKIDPITLPPKSRLGIVDNRNMGDPNSRFVDIFPGDMMKVNFRLVSDPTVRASWDAEMEEELKKGTISVKRNLETLITDLKNNRINIRHTLIIKNENPYPLYEVYYDETSPFKVISGTVYVNEGSFTNPKQTDNGFTFYFPMIAPQEELRMTFLTLMPEKTFDSKGSFLFRKEPKGEAIVKTVNVPVVINRERQDEYRLTVHFDFGEYTLTDPAIQSLETVAEFLRKKDYKNIYIQLQGHTDAVSVRKDRTDYETNLQLSEKRIQSVKDYLKSRLIDVEKMKESKDQIKDTRVKAYIENLVGAQPSDSVVYSLHVETYNDKASAQNECEKLRTEYDLDCLVEEVVQLPDKRYQVLLGRFGSDREAKDVSEKLFKKSLPVRIVEKDKWSVIEDDQTVLVNQDIAKGGAEPVVENRVSAAGTPQNRRVEIRVVPLGVKAEKTETSEIIEFGEKLSSGMYTLEMFFGFDHPQGDLYDLTLYATLPEGASYINGSATLNGYSVKPVKENGFFSMSMKSVDGDQEVPALLRFVTSKEMTLEFIPVVVFAKTQNGKVLTATNSHEKPETVDHAQKFYMKADKNPENIYQTDVRALKREVRFGILNPADDIIQSQRNARVTLSIPMNTTHRLLLNEEPVSEDHIGEKTKDSELNVEMFEYLGLSLKEGKNVFRLVNPLISDEKTITVTGEVNDIKSEIYPEKPPADGKSPAYLLLYLTDKNGNPVTENAYLEIRADKGDIYDPETDQYKRYIDDGFKVRVISGKATVKLSPASTTEERELTVAYGNIERDFTVKFYPEQRPWIIVGSADGAVGFSDQRNPPIEMSDSPFDHSEGDVNYQGRFSVFGKGNIKDYTVTFRYDTDAPVETSNLMEQNNPGTEEDRFYPIYGDESEPFYEAQSSKSLYLKVEKELSYLLYGDFKTEFGKDFEYNTYDRTLSGALVQIEKNKNYRIRTFASENRQSILRELIEGRGISGPYFLDNGDVIEYSEKVTLEIRDRFNPSIVLETIEQSRFTDYDINYEDGFIIFHQPVQTTDDDFNPIMIQVVYETENLAEERYLYGVRAEKDFFDSKLTFGAMGTLEEHTVDDKKIYGFDVKYDDNKNLTVIGEWTLTENYIDDTMDSTSGEARHLKAEYKIGQNTQMSAYYKNVEDGFQNLSSSDAETNYETYGAEGKTTLNDGDTVVTADVLIDDQESVDRVRAETQVEQTVTEKIKAKLGARWNSEDRDLGDGVEETSQIIGGVKYNPTNKIGITVTRDQSVSGDADSSYYPNKTAGKITYQITESVDAYLNTELREEPESDVSITTVGLDTRITENTTAFSKYSVDDSVSGWRNQAHLGMNHQFIFTKDFTLDLGIEHVQTVSGEEEDDYIAPRMGFTYLQKDRYKLTGKAEVRYEDEGSESLFSLGGTVKLNPRNTLFAKGRYFDSSYIEKNVLLGFAHRPVFSDKVNLISKFRWKNRNEDFEETKYIGSFHVNYQAFPKLTFMGEYAFKYTEIENIDYTYTDVVRARILYDINDRFDVGLHGGILHQYDSNAYTLSYGPEIGMKVIENIWLSVGYNFQGFYDEDFDNANYWAQGPYVKLRVKFDENTLKNLYNKIKGKKN